MKLTTHLESKEDIKYPYDAVIVLSGGVRKEGTGYAPTRFEDRDHFGMLGGEVRIAAAAALYEQQESKNFVFTTGVSEKDKELHGADVPAQSQVYSEAFNKEVGRLVGSQGKQDQPLEKPEAFIDDESTTTLGNVEEALKLIEQNGWKKVAVVTSKYHKKRSKALFEMMTRESDIKVKLSFKSAEDIVQEAYPGRYDAEIEAAYNSPAGIERKKNEKQGLRDILSGNYATEEFQLVQNKEEKEDTGPIGKIGPQEDQQELQKTV